MPLAQLALDLLLGHAAALACAWVMLIVSVALRASGAPLGAEGVGAGRATTHCGVDHLDVRVFLEIALRACFSHGERLCVGAARLQLNVDLRLTQVVGRDEGAGDLAQEERRAGWRRQRRSVMRERLAPMRQAPASQTCR